MWLLTEDGELANLNAFSFIRVEAVEGDYPQGEERFRVAAWKAYNEEPVILTSPMTQDEADALLSRIVAKLDPVMVRPMEAGE